MKIVKLTAENVKKLRAVEITPTGELVEITGRNGQGKTSVLDAIWWALAGTKHIQAAPIRKGSDKARIRLDLGELIVERRITPAGGTLTVENAEGALYKSPQGMLDALLGALAFDPLAFVQQKPRDQFDTLRGIVQLDVDLDKLDGLNRADYAKRTDVNRDAKALRAQADAIAIPDGLPPAPIDTAALKDQMAAASRTNAEIEQRRAKREHAARDVETALKGAAAARAEAARLREAADLKDHEAAVLDETAAALRQKLEEAPPLPPLVDADALRAELDAAEKTNRQVEQRDRKLKLLKDVTTLEKESAELTDTMEARENAKAAAIASAAMPVPGLSFGDGIVTFNGIPFDQASSAEQLRVSVAIAMAANPKLRVLRIKEGSLLDDANLALIAAMAREHDYQVWIETVQSSGRSAVVIEDGSVAEVRVAEVADAQSE